MSNHLLFFVVQTMKTTIARTLWWKVELLKPWF